MERSAVLLILCAWIASLVPGVMLQVQDQSGFISIDCGAPNSYNEEKINIDFLPDEGFIDSGENINISTEFIHWQYYQMSKNLRSFPNGMRNCYTLRPDKGKGNTYLIRASFWYGNYDKKNQIPIFDLYIDVNYWATINTSNYVHQEIVYVPPRDYIQVCLVNIDKGVPFISALELRTLDNSLYQIESGFLRLGARFNVGGLTIRYPDDVYDRIWENQTFPAWLMLDPGYGTSASKLSDNNDAYKVPGEVLLTAQTKVDATYTLTYYFTSMNSTYKWIGCFHFAETRSFLNGWQREFNVFTSDGQFTETVKLEYLKPVTVISTPITGSTISFSFQATTRQSGYPAPIINALEIFRIQELPDVPTALDDVKALTDIKAEYNMNKDSWQGDPCVPSKFAWDGVNCSYGDIPRVISLNMSSSNLRGIISSSLSNLLELESLDLSNNQLTGAIPETLGNLPKLRILNLSRNKLGASVPEALIIKVKDNKLDLRLDNNTNGCLASPCLKGEPKKSILVPVVASISVLFVVICVLTIASIRRKPSIGMERLKPYNRGEISSIINKAPKIGEGAFGEVYRCSLDDHTTVAVKVLSKSSWQGRKEFLAELQLSSRAHHGNLVSLLGYCDHCKKMALVYEFMANGNLEEHLSGKKPNVLTWSERLQIALDVAQGLNYLHNGCNPPIIHRDLKASNILLSEEKEAKISDFGLSRASTTKSGGYMSSTPLGTEGYLDPEYQKRSHSLNKKSDVYSFGIVLFELLTGHPAIMNRPGRKIVPILEHVTPFIRNENNTLGLMDPRLERKFNDDSARKVVKIAESCTRERSVERPDISEVLTELQGSLTRE